MEIFLCVVEAGSFAAAARREGISPSSVTRAIATLEDRVGQALFLRNTRRMTLSDSGIAYLADCRQILTDLKEAEALAAGTFATPSGHLTVSAPARFGETFIAPLADQYLDQFPDTTITFLFTDRTIDFLGEHIDIAVKPGRLQSEHDDMVRIGQVRQVVCTSPRYLKKHGRPSHPEQLCSHDTITSITSMFSPDWQFQRNDRSLTITPCSRLTVTSDEAALALVRRGWGITRAPSYQVARDIEEGHLELLLTDYEQPPLPVYVAFRERVKASVKVRCFFDYLIRNIRLTA
ncbi:LysR family transcriptional regulator [Pseudomonas sp. NPDC090202]|uniref:LysR family transcriptional regulator n=1 Tax=unclassified Pseudomonas TaxID=196821 RepID=UPI003822E582